MCTDSTDSPRAPAVTCDCAHIDHIYSHIIASNNVKVNTMDNLDDSELRLLKHPRWSPSPVDLSIANVVPPASALIASLGAAYYCSGPGPVVSPTAKSGYHFNGLMVSKQTPPVLSSRKQREFIPEAKKDDCYWDRRKRNNEAAKRSREKRRISDMVLEARVMELTRENSVLRAELYAIKEKFGLSQAQAFVDTDGIPVSLGDNGNRARRSRLLSNITVTNSGELNSSGNSTTSYISSSSSPTSQSSSSSEQLVPTPTLTPNLATLSSLTYSPPTLSMPETICCGPNISPICPIGSVNTASLPFKLRHKAKNNNNDSDSGSDSYANVLTDITSNQSVINNSNANFNDNVGPNDSPNGSNASNNSVVNDSMLKSENYALRSELQRLATEVASLKNVLVYNPTQPSLKTISANDNHHSNSYHDDSRPESPNSKSEQNQAINGSAVMSNEREPH